MTSGGLDDLVDEITGELDQHLVQVDAELARRYPGGRPGRQPVHTVYVPADRFDAGRVATYGDTALRATEEHEAVLLSLLDGDVDLRARVREGGCSRVIGLRNRDNELATVSFTADPASLDDGEAARVRVLVR